MYYANESNASSIGWVSYFFAIFTIMIIALSIITVCRYGISLFPISQERKRIGIMVIVIFSIAFLIFSIFFITFYSVGNLTDTLAKVLWVIYPAGSIAPFILAVVMIFFFKSIKQGNQVRLAQYFLGAFLPQAAFTVLDFFLFRQLTFRFTHLTYLVFGLLNFYYISTNYFLRYENNTGISLEKKIISSYGFSERELEVLKLLVEGKTNIEIGDSLCISVNTVKSHVKSIYRKSEVSNRVQLLHKIREST
jgi:Response regulator containing a CheY-like receiver domain and an HTH DNA-binding domain